MKVSLQPSELQLMLFQVRKYMTGTISNYRISQKGNIM